MQKFIGGIGCFWDEGKIRNDSRYNFLLNVDIVEVKSPTVNYKQICGGNTEHVEVVKS